MTTTAWLQALTAPAAVALVGTSADPAKLTARPLLFLRRHGFGGRIYPVNPSHDTVQGLRAYPSVTAIPEPVEHAYILLGGSAVEAALQDCIAAGVKVVSVLADGFAEAGEQGQARQARLAELAERAGILLLGPNSMGVVDTRSGFACTTNAALNTEQLPVGRLAVLSQSGSIIGTLLSRGQARGVAFASLLSVGNEAVADVGELGQILLDDDGIDAFALFLETVRNPAALTEFVRGATARDKPVVAYLIGRSAEGQALAVSHTGALTGSAEAVDSYLKHIGVHRVSQFDALFEAPAALLAAARASARPRSVTVVATTGGGGAMLIDQLSTRGVCIAACSDASRAALQAEGITIGHGKLVDVTLAGARYEVMRAVVSWLINDPETGTLVVAIGSSAQFHPELAVKPIVDALAAATTGSAADSASAPAPVFAFPLPIAEQSIRLLEAGGVPCFRSLESCADSIALVVNSRPPAEPLANTVVLPSQVAELLADADPGVMNEVAAGQVFAALGIGRPQQQHLAVDAPLPDIEALGLRFPVVAKLVSSDFAHKTEAGAVRIGLPGRDQLAQAVTEMRAAAAAIVPAAVIQGVLIQQQCEGVGEALIGLTRDPLVGPVVTVAAGGIAAELYRDAAVRPAPVSLATAAEMIAEVQGFALLRGFRGRPPGDLKALAAALQAVSLLALADCVAEAEINPLLVRTSGQGVVMLDALIRIHAADHGRGGALDVRRR